MLCSIVGNKLIYYVFVFFNNVSLYVQYYLLVVKRVSDVKYIEFQ